MRNGVRFFFAQLFAPLFHFAHSMKSSTPPYNRIKIEKFSPWLFELAQNVTFTIRFSFVRMSCYSFYIPFFVLVLPQWASLDCSQDFNCKLKSNEKIRNYISNVWKFSHLLPQYNERITWMGRTKLDKLCLDFIELNTCAMKWQSLHIYKSQLSFIVAVNSFGLKPFF